MFGLTQRVVTPERMDQPGLAPAEQRRALAGLARINAVSRAAAAIWRQIDSLAPRGATLRLLDVACGGGDVVCALWDRARRHGRRLDIDGWDISEVAVEAASAHAAQRRVPARFHHRDALNRPLPAHYDVIMCSLFLHHLGQRAARDLLSAMGRAARRLVLIEDLHRDAAGYALAVLGTRVLSRSPVVHVDGPLSVRAAFRSDEILALAHEADLLSPRVHRHWPRRLTLVATPPGAGQP